MDSRDGLHYEELAQLGVSGLPNEATLRFRGDRALALVRREGGSGAGAAWIGRARPPYLSWSWSETHERLGGPNFIVLPDGGLVAAARIWRAHKPVVAICRMSERSLEPILELPSGGDCGYPGLAWYRGRLWASYYSSHEGRARIYIAVCALGSS